jgi:hypothetical protein
VFYKSRKTANVILELVYCWANREEQCKVARRLHVTTGTVSRYFKRFREICMADEVNYYQGCQIGGKGIIVEIDESKFGKKKYNRGHPVEGNWVWGCVERIVDPNTGYTSAGKCIMVVVDKRDIATLKPLILRFIKPGSYIISDCYSSYRGIKFYEAPDAAKPIMSDQEYYSYYGNVGTREPNPFRECLYKYDAVNHSETYKDPFTGAHTNTIEGQWQVAKAKIPEQCYHDKVVLQEYLYEFAWEARRKKHGRFYAMLDSMRMVRLHEEQHIDDTIPQFTGEHTGEHPWQPAAEPSPNRERLTAGVAQDTAE